jgi:hypothetical protein
MSTMARAMSPFNARAGNGARPRRAARRVPNCKGTVQRASIGDGGMRVSPWISGISIAT